MSIVQPLVALLILLTLFFSEQKINKQVFTSALQSKVCSFDKHCHLIFNKDNKIKEIKPGIKTLLSILSTNLKKIADQYNVDPRALAAVIATENTLNVSVDDEIQNFLANFGVTSVFGQKFSYGLGQVFPTTAMKVDHIVAKLDKREAYNYEQVAVALTSPVGALKYAAAILKDAQDKYESVGLNISGDVGVLATLYNIGINKERLNHLTKNHKPRINYFGLYAIMNLKTIEDAIGWSPENGNYKPKFFLASEILKNRNYLTESVKLYPAPQRCQLQTTRDKRAIDTNYPAIKKVSGAFKLIRSTLSCGFLRWSLIRLSSGELGWVQNKILKKKSINKKNIINNLSSDSNGCMVKDAYALKRTESKKFDISNFFKRNCHLPAVTADHIGEQHPCNIRLDETIKMISETLNSNTCYKKVLVPNKYLYEYIYSKYKHLRPFIIFDNLQVNSFTFYSNSTSKRVITFLPELNKAFK